MLSEITGGFDGQIFNGIRSVGRVPCDGLSRNGLPCVLVTNEDGRLDLAVVLV